MKSFKLTLIFGIVVILMAFVLFADAEVKTSIYEWKMVSADVAGGFATVFSERYAKLVEERSEGRIKIDVYPFGVLGAERDLVELVQLGDIELGAVSYGWLGGFVPQVQIFALQYIWPKKNSAEVIREVFENGKVVQLLGEKFRNKGLQLLAALSGGWQYVTSNVPIHSPEDCKGLKHRVMATPILVASYNAYGFNTQSLDYSEIYVALQNKLIDTQVNPLESLRDMHFYEVQEYATCVWNEMFIKLPVINRDVYDSLPKDLQQIVIESALDLVEPMAEWVKQNEKECRDEIKKEKPTFTFYDLTAEEVAPFRNLAWGKGGPLDAYLKISGEGGKEILDALLADVETAVKTVQNQ